MLDRADEDAEKDVSREDGRSNFGMLLRVQGLCEAGSVSEEKIWDGRGMVVANWEVIRDGCSVVISVQR